MLPLGGVVAVLVLAVVAVKIGLRGDQRRFARTLFLEATGQGRTRLFAESAARLDELRKERADAEDEEKERLDERIAETERRIALLRERAGERRA